MYAVIRTGGKQYRVEPGMTIHVEKLEGEAGATVQLSDVLLVADGANIKIGAPLVSGASVTAKIVQQTRGDKLVVFKFKRRKRYRNRNGHRQWLTTLQITSIA